MTFKMRTFILFSLFIFIYYSFLNAKTKPYEDESPLQLALAQDKIEGKPKIFIEGQLPDEVYMKKNINFVDFVNDPKVADVHIIITQRSTGAGGKSYSLMFYNVSFSNMSDYTLTCNSLPGSTDSEIWKLVVNTIKMGLMPFANQTGIGEHFAIRYKTKVEDSGNELIRDPWNNWTIRGDLFGNLNWEESRKILSTNYLLKVDRVTEDWRIRNAGRYYIKTSDIRKANGTIILDTISTSFISSSIVNSLTERWSAGLFVSAFNGTVRNTRYSYTFKPAIEYNIFPWDISDRKVFTIAYYIGPEWYSWYDKTVFNKTQEVHLEQALRLDLKLVKTWGDLDAGLSATNFIDDFQKYEVSFDTGASIRLVRGFALSFNFSTSSIHNQIYLRKKEASDEELLLGTVKLPTSFDISANIGVRIQFGSIYNNIVNNRL